MSLLGLEEQVENDPCKFVLSCRGSSERFTLQAANTDVKQVWVQHIADLLDLQNKFLSGEETRHVRELSSGACLCKPMLSVRSPSVSDRISEGAERLSVSDPQDVRRRARSSVRQTQLHRLARSRETLGTELDASKATYLQRQFMPRPGPIPLAQGERVNPFI